MTGLPTRRDAPPDVRVAAVSRRRSSTPGRYDLILAGTSFASSFFLHEYLASAPEDARVLVLERGARNAHAWMLEQEKHSELTQDETSINNHPSKKWASNITFGGNSNCWWACTPRMLPQDFELHRRYGVGVDWPVSYDELEPYYVDAERIMSISGPAESPFPRSAPYPQPPHQLSGPDRRLKKAYPDLFFNQPTARAAQATKRRARCCATSRCDLCPIDAKFTIQNELAWLYDDPRVELRTGCEVHALQTAAGIVDGVLCREGNDERVYRADLVGLGANALFNPAILLRSGIDDGPVGCYLGEQVSIMAHVLLKGVKGYDGSTAITGHGYNLYDGAHRKQRAAALIETHNFPWIRPEFGRWSESMRLKLIVEDIPRKDDRVVIDRDSDKPETIFSDYSSYAKNTVAEAESLLLEVLQPLPVERLMVNPELSNTEAHILGTTRMGTDPEQSVIDDRLVHHRYRNLLLLGGGSFPTAAPANPTLTICALSLRSARLLMRGEH